MRLVEAPTLSDDSRANAEGAITGIEVLVALWRERGMPQTAERLQVYLIEQLRDAQPFATWEQAMNVVSELRGLVYYYQGDGRADMAMGWRRFADHIEARAKHRFVEAALKRSG